ncbi:MAG: MscL family protein [Candidatus Aenigmatarchaeota archaeon]
MSFLKEFIDFMKKQNVIAVALAFVLGIATAQLVQALVTDIITPIYAPYLDFLNPELAIEIGKSKFLIGDFIRQLVNWVVILLVVFIIGTKIAKTK